LVRNLRRALTTLREGVTGQSRQQGKGDGGRKAEARLHAQLVQTPDWK
jgi:hypothetical protein